MKFRPKSGAKFQAALRISTGRGLPEMSATITMLGNSATQTADYETTSFLVRSSQTSILVDCGPGITRQLMRLDCNLESIDTVVVSHIHADHSGGFSYLLFLMGYALMQRGEKKTLQVVCLEDVRNALAEMWHLQYPRPIPNLEVEWIVAAGTGGVTLDDRGFQTSTVLVEHAVPNIGLRIDTVDGALAYSSDTVYSDAFVELADASKVFIHEAFCTSSKKQLAERARHSTAHEAGRASVAAHAERLFLAHPLPEYRIDPAGLVGEAASVFPGEIVLPGELDVISLSPLVQ